MSLNVGRTVLGNTGVSASAWSIVEGSQGGVIMRSYHFVVERDPDSSLLVGYVP